MQFEKRWMIGAAISVVATAGIGGCGGVDGGSDPGAETNATETPEPSGKGDNLSGEDVCEFEQLSEAPRSDDVSPLNISVNRIDGGEREGQYQFGARHTTQEAIDKVERVQYYVDGYLVGTGNPKPHGENYPLSTEIHTKENSRSLKALGFNEECEIVAQGNGAFDAKYPGEPYTYLVQNGETTFQFGVKDALPAKNLYYIKTFKFDGVSMKDHESNAIGKQKGHYRLTLDFANIDSIGTSGGHTFTIDLEASGAESTNDHKFERRIDLPKRKP